ncbi:hypothetical protein QFC24_003028 [Naganishia onofrii]|uniref:Uncharacterized protein n=1 Tax=Naganishia onofrii TaxID=1851511 RepID=A0ACC2XNS0_9TREE|nr:hypothetical protein QFC24_003028 [Naganishia onofrii]
MEPLHHEQSKEVKPQAEEIHVAGVIVPPKPSPPESDECCMSGCVNCVYTLYADDLLAYNESLANALTALRTSGTPQSSWPADIRAFAEKGRAVGDDSAAAFGSSRRDVVDEAEKMTREEIMRDVLEDVDPALRAFLE